MQGLTITIFQSTLPIREETRACGAFCRLAAFQSTLPIREETAGITDAGAVSLFQSTLPIREETAVGKVSELDGVISIHSSHTGRDNRYTTIDEDQANFNPLFPYGKRHYEKPCAVHHRNFNPLFPYGKRPFKMISSA